MRLARPAAGVVGLTGIAVVVLALMQSCAPVAPIHLVAAGNMSCSPDDPAYTSGTGTGITCRQLAVSDLALGLHPDTVLGLGNYQYEVPSAKDYATAYDPTWGRLRAITRPAVGNQELKVHDANTFYTYFAEQAGPPAGYYSYELGGWHVVVIDTNCTSVLGGCGPQSPQVHWLVDDLASNSQQCVLAYGHHPRWSNGIAGPDPAVDSLFSTLAEYGVDLYLSAHDADYERFPRLDGTGHPSPGGTRQFVVGTGGQEVYKPAEGDASWRTAFAPTPDEAFDTVDPGVLSLELRADGYSWKFHTLSHGITDNGADTC
jgi:hypothetical protein